MGIDWLHIDLVKTAILITTLGTAFFMLVKLASLAFWRPVRGFVAHVNDSLANQQGALDRIESIKIESHGRIEANQETIRRRLEEHTEMEEIQTQQVATDLTHIKNQMESFTTTASTVAADLAFKVTETAKSLSDQVAKTNKDASEHRLLILEKVSHIDGTLKEHGKRLDDVEKVVFKVTLSKVKKTSKRK